MTLKDALKRIEELERKVRELEAQPKQILEYHFHQPALAPAPVYPAIPQPYYPLPWWAPTWAASSTSVPELNAS